MLPPCNDEAEALRLYPDNPALWKGSHAGERAAYVAGREDARAALAPAGTVTVSRAWLEQIGVALLVASHDKRSLFAAEIDLILGAQP